MAELAKQPPRIDQRGLPLIEKRNAEKFHTLPRVPLFPHAAAFSCRPGRAASLVITMHTPGRARTCDLRLRRPALYPTELRARRKSV